MELSVPLGGYEKSLQAETLKSSSFPVSIKRVLVLSYSSLGRATLPGPFLSGTQAVSSRKAVLFFPLSSLAKCMK